MAEQYANPQKYAETEIRLYQQVFFTAFHLSHEQ